MAAIDPLRLREASKQAPATRQKLPPPRTLASSSGGNAFGRSNANARPKQTRNKALPPPTRTSTPSPTDRCLASRMGGVAPPLTASWRALAAAALALWLVPVVLALALLWLPLLCCAVAALRFRRVRKSRGRGGSSWREETTVDDAGDRARLLHRYLRDQMELVVAGAGGAGDLLDMEEHPADQ